MASLMFSAEDLAAMTPEEQDAILDALVVAVVADAAVGAEEIARFNAEVGAVPWGRSMEEVARMAQSARARVSGLKTDRERLQMLKSISGRLPADAKAKVLAMMARVMMADKNMNETERNVLTAFALAFGLPGDKVAEIARSISN